MKKILTVLLFACSAFGQATWINPTDEQMARALELGFEGQKPPYHMQSYNPQKSKVGDDFRQQPTITLLTPLLCAYGLGVNAHNALQNKPDTDVTRERCVGRVIVTAVHISPSLNTNWPVVLEKGGSRVQPIASVPDKMPGVTSYTTPFGKGVGYQYTDRYIFSVPKEWVDGFQLTYADDSGKHHTIDIKTSPFIADLR